MDRHLFLGKSKRQDSGDTKFDEATEKWLNEVYKLTGKPFPKRKEEEDLLTLTEEDLLTLTKELKGTRRMEDARMHDLDRLQKTNKELVAKLEQVEKKKKFAPESNSELIETLVKESKKALCGDRFKKVNKELVAKLEEVEKDRKFAVESRIELMKILDEERKKVSCLEEKCVNLEKGIESQKIAYMERKITYKSKILEEKEKLEVEREKNRAFEEEVDKYKRLIEENDLIARRKEGLGNIMMFESAEELEKVRKVMWEHMMRQKRMDRMVRLEKTGRTEADCGKNKLETHILVDANTDDCQDTLFGSEDTVYVDFDSFEVVENF